MCCKYDCEVTNISIEIKRGKMNTTINESWPNNCSDIEATAQDNNWETRDSGNWKQTCAVASGIVKTDGGNNSWWHYARCTSALSSADHYATAPLTVSANYGGGTASRMASGANTCYTFDYYTNNYRRIWKWVADSPTNIATTAMSGAISAVGWKCDISGTTLTGIATGYSNLQGTDSAISGNLYCGIGLVPGAGAADNCVLGAWQASDGIVPANPKSPFGGIMLNGPFRRNIF